MRKIFYLLGLLTIFNGLLRAQEGSINISLSIYDTNEQFFLDTVESKLLSTVNRLPESVNCYNVNPIDGTDWGVRLSKNEIKYINFPKNYLPTYKYQLIINWNATLDTGYILGFSKEYYYDLWVHDYNYKKSVSAGVFCRPLYHIPLAEYKTFLNQEEVSRLYKLIKKNFICYINYDTIVWHCNDTSSGASFFSSDTSSLSYRTISMDKSNYFVLTSLPTLAWLIKQQITSGEFYCYKDPWCIKPFPNYRSSLYIFSIKIENVYDEDGKKTSITNDCLISSITVAESWKFDTISNSRKQNYGIDYPIKITRKIKSIAINTRCDNGSTIIDKRLWLTYQDIDELSKKEKIQYYKVILDNELFKKLNLKYFSSPF